MQEIISDISFIIIALNEEFAIKKCLNSIAKMRLLNCEIICVDSDSTDNTLAIMKDYKAKVECFKIFVLKGYANPAIARNIGLAHASKKYIFFVDGDIELSDEFIKKAIVKLSDGWDVVTGRLEEYQYSRGHKRLLNKITDRMAIKRESAVCFTGGAFIAKREATKETGKFDERLGNSEDLEFTLRLARLYKIIAIKESMGIHHTIPYSNLIRIKEGLTKFYGVYYGMVFRKNLVFRKGIYELIMRGYGTILGVFAVFFFVILFFYLNIETAFFIVFLILLLDIMYMNTKKKGVIAALYAHYIYPFYFLFGILFDINLTKKYSVFEVT